MKIQREVYQTELNECNVPHNVIVGYEEVEVEEFKEEETLQDKIEKLQEELNKLKEQL